MYYVFGELHYLFYDLSLLYFSLLIFTIGSVLLVNPILSRESASFVFCVLLLQLLFLFSSDISVRFSSSALMKPPFFFTPFSFPAQTLLSLFSPFLYPSVPILEFPFLPFYYKFKSFCFISIIWLFLSFYFIY